MNNTNKRISNLNKRIDQLIKSRKTINRQRPRSAPVANGATSSSRNQAGANRYKVRQTERFSSIIADGTSNFVISSSTINPGLSFPWLANIAKSYDKYKLNSLRFTFKTSQPTLTAGTVGLGFDYNPLDSSPRNSIEFSQLTTWNVQSVWKNFSLTVDTSRQLWNYLFIRSGLLGGTDLKTYDIGKLHFMYEGIPTAVTAGTILGYIEVTYDIELIDKQPSAILLDFSQGLLSMALGMNTSTSGAGSISASHKVVLSAPHDWTVNNLDLDQALGNESYGSGATYTAAITSYLVTHSNVNPLILDKGIYNISIKVPTSLKMTFDGLLDNTGSLLIAPDSSNKIVSTIVVPDATTYYLGWTVGGSGVSSSDFGSVVNALQIVIQKI